ncbi:MAG: hypothetical protein LC122_14420 [Chitinophagales bacterium]|nr:hypothetical protein [Chitinophagales bacterium]
MILQDFNEAVCPICNEKIINKESNVYRYNYICSNKQKNHRYEISLSADDNMVIFMYGFAKEWMLKDATVLKGYTINNDEVILFNEMSYRSFFADLKLLINKLKHSKIYKYYMRI